MRVLFIAAGTSPAGVFALAPLATAIRNAGHDILFASFGELTPTITEVGLPAVAVATGHTTDSIKQLPDRPGGTLDFPWTPEEELPYVGRWFGRQAAVSLDDLVELAGAWRPDLIVGGTDAHAGPLLGARLSVPYVRQAWDWLHFDGVRQYVDEELGPELEQLGLDRLPAPDLFLDICPPSLIPASAEAGRPMRWVPGNRQRPLEPWMYRAGGRRRVCVTLGSFRTSMPKLFDYLCGLVESLSELDAEIVVAANETAAEQLRQRFPEVRSGWVPMEFLARTCDAVVHAGGLTALNAMAAGTPQVVVNRFRAFEESLGLLQEQGSAVALNGDAASPANTLEACRSILTDESYAKRARELSLELAGMPSPNTVVADLEALAG
ncbi:nucleotide disphospho-sugar-binding domain-containing protein [Streptomyces sp. 891-h]|uniref:nucleotide disphospho-sugar-binding domain-containing protein n=1 Tax=unclassified Streptomyces TaxID=2593676 RepID=UPI001FAAD37B|nr:nucleotide disphospho-sugar-binding domain-containing protein [Streptomyces sp. 891-h]UNZ20458.1 DUF1205 domain-containing protein [Streptomyces sp. 891-h]